MIGTDLGAGVVMDGLQAPAGVTLAHPVGQHMDGTVADLRQDAGGVASVGVDRQPQRRVIPQHAGLDHMLMIEIIIYGNTRPHAQGIGERIGTIYLTGGEAEKLRSQFRQWLSKFYVATGKAGLERFNELRLAVRCMHRLHGQDHPPLYHLHADGLHQKLIKSIFLYPYLNWSKLRVDIENALDDLIRLPSSAAAVPDDELVTDPAPDRPAGG